MIWTAGEKDISRNTYISWMTIDQIVLPSEGIIIMTISNTVPVHTRVAL